MEIFFGCALWKLWAYLCIDFIHTKEPEAACQILILYDDANIDTYRIQVPLGKGRSGAQGFVRGAINIQT